MRDYVTLFAFDADGPYYTAGVFQAGHAEAAIDQARGVCAARLREQPTLFVATPARNWTAYTFQEETVTRRHEAAVPTEPAGVRMAARAETLAVVAEMDEDAADTGHSVKVAS